MEALSMPIQVNTHEAKTNLSKLLARVKAGEEIIIANAGQPVARLVPIEDRPMQRTPGSAQGRITIAPDFDTPLPEKVLRTFEE
jgi:prevent-host-death family protein